ncbi:MAG TPA: autotransporter domain-containing protein, partial [Rhizomicrobium sp.]
EGNFVIVNNSGAIETWGYGAVGIFGQSIGGGGGISGAGAEKTEKIPLSKGLEVGGGFGSNGGSAGNGGTVWITNTGSIVTRNEVAYGLFAQSIGGGGGVGGIGSSEGGIIAADIGVGGNGGSSGNGGHILINQTGNITTLGNMSFGVFGQSVGGGGGVGGAGRGEYTSKVTVAGRGGSGGNGGPVDMFVKGNIATQGGGAFGVFAQSVGGGGGVAGDVEGTPITILGVTVYNKPVSGLIAVAGIGGVGGDGGAVTVNFEGNIVTTGFGADGIEAQSIGGGGGIRGASVDGLTIKGSTGDLGSGGTVDVTHKGNISATGANADGIYAQSMGCHVTATTTCIVPPLPLHLALLLPPVGTLDANGSAITISVSGGTVTGGSGDGAGIEMSNGAANVITIVSDSTVTALSGMAILATSSNPRVSDTVNNAGRVFGNVSLTGGKPSAFNNLAGAVFRPNSKVDLDDGDLTNTGTLQPGGPGSGAIVALTGNLMENAGSVYDIDVGFGLGATDRIDASGTATVGGTIVPHFTAIMNQPTVIVTSAGAMTSANPVSQFNSVVLHFTLDFSAHALTLTPVANWAPPGMTDNETAVGRYFQAIWNGGGAVPLAGDMGILADIASLPAFADALNHMTPAVYATAIAGRQENAQNFADNMMSCHGLSDAHSAITEEDCHWVELSGGRRKQTGTTSADPSDYRDIRAQTGHQIHLNRDWVLGAAIGYDKWHGTTGTLGRTSGEDFSAGLVAKYLDGNWLHVGALSASYGSLSAARLLTIPVPTGVFGHTHTFTAGLRGRSAYLFYAGAFYFKPYADLDLNYYHMDGFVETGGGALSLHVADKGKFAAILSPMLETGAVFRLFGTSIARPYLLGGVIVSSGGNWAVSAGFDGAPPSIPNFTITEPSHTFMGRVGGGIELLNAGDVLLKVEYDSRLAGHYSSWNGMAKLGVEF